MFARYEKPERAVEIAQEIPDEAEQTNALSQIGQVFTLQGKDEQARLAVNSIAEDSDRLFALIGISDSQNRQEKLSEAIETLNEAAQLADSVQHLTPRSQAYNELARRLHEHGETERAREISIENLETISNIRDEKNRAVALARLAEFYESAGYDLTEKEKEILRALTKSAEW